jgi:hypothetical protein
VAIADLWQLLAAIARANETGDRPVGCVDGALVAMTAIHRGKVDANGVGCGLHGCSPQRYQDLASNICRSITQSNRPKCAFTRTVHAPGDALTAGWPRDLSTRRVSRKVRAAQTVVDLMLRDGHCEVHERFRAPDLRSYRQVDQAVRILAYPECSPDILEEAGEQAMRTNTSHTRSRTNPRSHRRRPSSTTPAGVPPRTARGTLTVVDEVRLRK